MLPVLLAAVAIAAAPRPASLRCEFRVNPLGIDSAAPRLSWTIESKRRGEMQSAYQVVVSGTPSHVTSGDLWNTGEVKSDRSNMVAYAGKPLHSGQEVWWCVRVWDHDGKPSAWSPAAHWEMGLLAAQDWKAKWIGLPGSPESAVDTRSLKWIWYPEGDPRRLAPAGDRFFRRTFDVPAGRKVVTALLVYGVDNSCEASINGHEAGSADGWQSMRPLDVTADVVSGRNIISFKANNTDGPAGLTAALQIRYDDGTTTRISTDSRWKSAMSPSQGWQQARFDDADWKPAMVIASMGDSPWGMAESSSAAEPCPYLRTQFAADKPIRRARIYSTALGVYELYINGRRVSADALRPGWTDYHTRVQYQSYDVTSLVHAGDNALGVILGDGWYCGYVGFGHRRSHYGSHPLALAQLEIEYTDGTRATIVTDGSWKGAHGALLASDLLMGESYDARAEMAGWSAAHFDDSRWKPVVPETTPGVIAPPNTKPHAPDAFPGGLTLVAQPDASVHQVGMIVPKSVTQHPAGHYVFDLGQNMVGCARLRVNGPAGTKVTLKFAEMLNPDGTIYTANLRGARATDEYTLRGGGEEVYEPHFTFHGFRYVELTGYPGVPTKNAVTGIVESSVDIDQNAFACSSPMVNQLQHNIQWGMRGNYLEVPTDCPQRDERLGWMGDAQIFVRTGCFNADIAAFMEKWATDVDDAQSVDGGFSDVSPRVVDPSDGAPAWGDAGVIVPWTIYAAYGDTRILERHYDAMAKWIDYIHDANPNLLWRNRGNNNFGDWLSINADTPRDVLGTAYFAYDTSLMARIAHALGRADDERKYSELFEGIKAAFNKAFVSADGRIKGNTQTCYVLALRFDLLPKALRPSAAGYLAADIENRSWHLSTGFVGVGYLTPTLTANGHLDIAYRLLNQDTFPSWGYSIRHGATTIWERWDGWTAEKGFQDPGMNSFNHYSLGSVGEWMYSGVAGIDLDPEAPGYKHILLRPHPGGGLTNARSAVDSIYGRIESAWTDENGTFQYDAVVPANTTATLFLPVQVGGTVLEGGQEAAHAPGVHFVREESGVAMYEIGSGTYHFVSKP